MSTSERQHGRYDSRRSSTSNNINHNKVPPDTTTTASSNNHSSLPPPPIYSVGASDAVLLVISLVGFVFLAWTVYSIILTKVQAGRENIGHADNNDDDGPIHEKNEYDEFLTKADVSTLTRAQRRARARHIMKQQRRLGPGGEETNIGDVDDNDEGGMGRNEYCGIRGLIRIVVDAVVGRRQGRPVPPQPPQPQQPQPQPQPQPDEQDVPPFQDDTHHMGTLRHIVSRRERQMAAKLVEKEERKVLEEERRKEQWEAQELARKRRIERERLFAIQAEEDRKLRQAQRKAEEWNQFQTWRTFLISSTSSASNDTTQQQSLSVKEWIQELKQQKVVNLTELSKRFQVPIDLVRTRIQELVDTSRITGILDIEHDCFIYLSPKTDLPAFAKFIQSQDMVTVQDVQNRIQEIINPM